MSLQTFPVLILCAFYFLTYSYIYADQDENVDVNTDWKWAVRKIKELEEQVRIQDERILTLEKRPTASEWASMVDIRKTVQKQHDRIVQLEARIDELETQTEIENNELVETRSPEHMHVTNSKRPMIHSKRSMAKNKRLLLQPTTVPVETVAFFAYFSTHNPPSTHHHILAFDTVITNVGKAYHPHSGTFIAPRTGLYVFTWTIRLWGSSYHTSELLVDNNIVNTIYLNPVDQIDGSVTGTAVVLVNQGDDVLVRTGSTYNNGDIKSDTNGRSSFAGWILM
ncbi:uncharacterized protein LOC111104290 [Crassostrea virginica]